MNRRRFISTALAAAAALPVFAQGLRGTGKPTWVTLAELGVSDGPPFVVSGGSACKPFISSGWSPCLLEMQDGDGNWVSLMTKARARKIADDLLERYSHPVVTFVEVNGQAVSEELLAELEAKARRRVGG